MADVDEMDKAGRICFVAIEVANEVVAEESIEDQRDVILGMMMAASTFAIGYHGEDRAMAREMMHAAVDLCIDSILVLPAETKN